MPNNTHNTFEIYDTATDSWSTGAPLPTPLSGAEVEAVNGKLYLLGGAAEGDVPNSSTYVYDPTANTWTSLVNRNTTEEYFGKGAINGKIYIFGGTQYIGGSSNVAYVYDPVANTWSTIGSLNTDREGNGGEALAGKLYAFGGLSDRQIPLVRQDAEFYDPVTNSWSFLPMLLNQPRYDMQATAVGNSIYVMGGTNFSSGAASNINESYDLNPATFTVTFAAGPGGTLTGTTSQTVANGGSATPVTAVAATGYNFVNWTGTGGFAATTANPLTVTNVTTNMVITANFAAVNGACGSSNGGTFTVIPSTNLCATGTPSIVTGNGPWSWICGGSNGGTTASCFTVVQGDANGDGKIDISDALMVLQIAVGLENATADILARADVAPLKDGKPAPDGIIDIADALMILKRAVGLVNW